MMATSSDENTEECSGTEKERVSCPQTKALPTPSLVFEPSHSGSASQFRANLFVELFLLVKTYSRRLN